MRTRLVLAAAALGALALAVPSALAAPAPATLDGKKVTKLTLTTTAAMQSNDKALVTDSVDDTDRMQCVAPRCAILPFVYAPAKGVSGDTLFSLSWVNEVSDFDLYVVSLDKAGRTRMAACGASVGTHEKLFFPAGTFKKGKSYALLADFYRTPGEKVTATVEMPGKNTVAKTVPANVDSIQATNCSL